MELIVLYISVIVLAVWVLISEIVIWRAFKRRDDDIAASDEELQRCERRLEDLRIRVRRIVGVLNTNERALARHLYFGECHMNASEVARRMGRSESRIRSLIGEEKEDGRKEKT